MAGWSDTIAATTRAGLPSVRRLDLALGSAAILAVTTVIAAPAAVAGLIPAHPILPAWAGPGPGQGSYAGPAEGAHFRQAESRGSHQRTSTGGIRGGCTNCHSAIEAIPKHTRAHSQAIA